MAESEVKSAVLWLGKLLADEVKYLDKVTGKVRTLQTELKTISNFLIGAVKTHRQDDLVQGALSDGRDIAYDCQDVIETYILQVAVHGYEDYQGGWRWGSIMRCACLIRKAVPVHGIVSQIDDLNARIDALKTNLRSYGISSRINNDIVAAEAARQVATKSEPLLRRVFTHEREEYVVVGLEQHLEELVETLLNPADQTVIVVCGMGGVGKSTLVTQLYHEPRLRGGGYFEAFGWAPASQQFNPTRLLRALLFSLVPEDDVEQRKRVKQAVDEDRAHAALYNLLIESKCLVVIDDLWDPEHWAMIQAAFPKKSSTGSRIVVTTRKQDILSSGSSGLDFDQVRLCPVRELDPDKSWELFAKTTFPGATCTDPIKEKLGREMLLHCKGVPLAIVVLGKVLKRKGRLDDWKQMHKDVSAQIQGGSAAKNPYKDVYDVLQVSYDELPVHLKHCFLHLANFPEDYEIQTEKLYQLWVGEGIVSKEESDSVHESEEDIAERYLDELVSRNIVQAVSWDKITERIKSCQLHDLMRDVCIDIARKEGFGKTIKGQRSMLLSNQKNEDHLLMTLLPEIDKRLRRLAVYITDQDQDEEMSSTIPINFASTSANLSRAPNLRSLLLFPVHEQRGDEDCKRLMEKISEDFPLLRVFDCEDYRIIQGKLPKKIGGMIHLRYLGMRNTRVTELPSSIENLTWLQTLDLRVEGGIVVSLPNVLWKMKQLRHIYLPHLGNLGLGERDGRDTAPEKYSIVGGEALLLDGLWNLQTIVNMDLDRVSLEGLSKLGRVKRLSVGCESNTKALYPLLKCSSLNSCSLRVHGRILNEDPMILSSCEVLHDLEILAKPYARFPLQKPLCLEMLPKSLVSLSIWYLQLYDDPMPVLEQLPNLNRLSMTMCYPRKYMACSAGGFPQLTDLYFDGLFGFSEWEVEQGALQKLKYLTLINCRVRKVPDAISSSVIVSLQDHMNILN